MPPLFTTLYHQSDIKITAMNLHKQLHQIHLTSLFILIIAAAGCTSSIPEAKKSADGKQLQSVTLMLNWFPEAEHGGFYAAQVHGLFEKYGLDVQIRAGGPAAPVAQELLTGRVQFAIGNGDDVLVFRQQKADIVALMAPIQDSPRCILVHDQSPIQNLNQLAGSTLLAGAGQPFRTFMEHRGLLKDVRIVPYDGNLANFIADKNVITQGYSFSEPFVAQQQGAKTRLLMVSEIGFNPYVSCLIATQSYIDKNRDLVGRMVKACREGWQKYLEEPQSTNDVILKLNSQGMTAEALTFGAEAIKPLCMPGSMTMDQIGSMSMDRWTTLSEQFVEIGLADAVNVPAGSLFTNDFLNP